MSLHQFAQRLSNHCPNTLSISFCGRFLAPFYIQLIIASVSNSIVTPVHLLSISAIYQSICAVTS